MIWGSLGEVEGGDAAVRCIIKEKNFLNDSLYNRQLQKTESYWELLSQLSAKIANLLPDWHIASVSTSVIAGQSHLSHYWSSHLPNDLNIGYKLHHVEAIIFYVRNIGIIYDSLSHFKDLY